MKKSFLVFGVLGALLVTNGYSVENGVEETSDVVSVVRAAKTGARVKKDTASPLQMTPDGGVVAITCPVGCTGTCFALNNLIVCECKKSDGTSCNLSEDDVVVGSSSSSSLR